MKKKHLIEEQIQLLRSTKSLKMLRFQVPRLLPYSRQF
jgi:hypothetical protein